MERGAERGGGGNRVCLERERETHTHTHTQRERQTDRQTETDGCRVGVRGKERVEGETVWVGMGRSGCKRDSRTGGCGKDRKRGRRGTDTLDRGGVGV